jgi:hypothetical protein
MLRPTQLSGSIRQTNCDPVCRAHCSFNRASVQGTDRWSHRRSLRDAHSRRH